MENLTDKFGQTVTENGDGSFSRAGITIPPGISRELVLAIFDGMAPPIIPFFSGTSISFELFIARFTIAEQTAVSLALQIDLQLLSWWCSLVANNNVYSSNPTLILLMAKLAGSGKLTPLRAIQITNLLVASP